MIADCETCERKQVPCFPCEESQRMICYRCHGDVDDPYCELENLSSGSNDAGHGNEPAKSELNGQDA